MNFSRRKHIQKINKRVDQCVNVKIIWPEKENKIETDASNLTIKAYLNQKYNGRQHSIVYLSKKLSSAKQSYDVHDKKLLAIIVALKNWKIYAEELSKLKILTDHKNLLHFTTIKQFN